VTLQLKKQNPLASAKRLGTAALFSLLMTTTLPVGHAMAEDLLIARGNEPVSIDPHFSRNGNNQMTSLHIFDRLLLSDENARPIPGLAVSWENEDELTWLVKLREGVQFHDGTPFTAQDVVYSFERAPDVPNSPASFAESLSTLESMEVVDDHTIRFTSNRPNPQFMENIGTIYIVSHIAAADAESIDFNDPAVAVGTGPFRFVSWVPGDRLILERNPDYWGEVSDFENVTMRFITNDAARVASLLAGDVDVIDLVAPADLPQLHAASNINVFETGTVRLVYLALNQADGAPLLTDQSGAPLDENPLQNSNVRKAISLMIDREGIVENILQGSGEAASQTVPEGVYGYTANLDVTQPDLEEAQRLLAEAGYPDGFGVTVHGSGDRFLMDGEITQAIGQMLARGGLQVNGVEVRPYSVYTGEAAAGEYSLFIFSYGNSSGEASRGLSNLFNTFDPDRDLGTLNRFRYSNPEFDELIARALEEFDLDLREQLLGEAAELALGEDTAMVPLYFQTLAWAAREGLEVIPRRDERTLAMSVSISE
jgi:peptide/nickel transport system substrate-binding protein